MGEHADDAMWDLLFGRGTATYGREYPTSIRCNRCGGGPLDWKQTGWENNRDGRIKPIFRLIEENGALHVCPPPKPEDLFEVLP